MGENPAALRAAVFSLASKNLRGVFKRPPAGRGLKMFLVWDCAKGGFKRQPICISVLAEMDTPVEGLGQTTGNLQ